MQNIIFNGYFILKGSVKVSNDDLVINSNNTEFDFKQKKIKIIHKNRDIGELDYEFKSDKISTYYKFKPIEIVEMERVQNLATIKLKVSLTKIAEFSHDMSLQQIEELSEDCTYLHNNIGTERIQINKPKDYENREQPKGIKTKLTDYQIEALNWMIRREKSIKDLIWMQSKPSTQEDNSEIEHQHVILVNNCRGGILAYREGVFQKLILISLIEIRYRQQDKILIIQTVLTDKWTEAFQEHSQNLYRICQYIGSNRENLNFDEYDIIITKYNIIRDVYKENPQHRLFGYNWTRIILDEAHQIKNHETKLAQAIFQLKGKYKWCLTHSPIQNSLSELYSFLRFLNLEPWCCEKLWDRYVGFPERSINYSCGDETNELDNRIKKIQDLVESIQRPIILKENVKYNQIMPTYLEFSKTEKELYASIEEVFTQIFEEKTNEDRCTLLRQLCDHPSMPTYIYVFKDMEIIKFICGKVFGKYDKFFLILQKLIEENKIPNCYSCRQYCQNVVVTQCKHFFCKKCLYSNFHKNNGQTLFQLKNQSQKRKKKQSQDYTKAVQDYEEGRDYHEFVREVNYFEFQDKQLKYNELNKTNQFDEETKKKRKSELERYINQYEEQFDKQQPSQQDNQNQLDDQNQNEQNQSVNKIDQFDQQNKRQQCESKSQIDEFCKKKSCEKKSSKKSFDQSSQKKECQKQSSKIQFNEISKMKSCEKQTRKVSQDELKNEQQSSEIQLSQSSQKIKSKKLSVESGQNACRKNYFKALIKKKSFENKRTKYFSEQLFEKKQYEKQSKSWEKKSNKYLSEGSTEKKKNEIQSKLIKNPQLNQSDQQCKRQKCGYKGQTKYIDELQKEQQNVEKYSQTNQSEEQLSVQHNQPSQSNQQNKEQQSVESAQQNQPQYNQPDQSNQQNNEQQSVFQTQTIQYNQQKNDKFWELIRQTNQSSRRKKFQLRTCPHCARIFKKHCIVQLMKKDLKFDEQYESSTKLDKVIEIINSLQEGDKCIVISYFVEMLELIRRKLPEDSYIQIKGGSAQLLLRRRQWEAQNFRTSDRKIMLLQSNIKLVGINLQLINHIIFVDPWWNPSVENYIIATVRNQLEKEVHIHKLIVKGTIEEDILAAQNKKLKLLQNFEF